MKLWINILSGNDPVTAQALGALSKSESVEVYSTVDDRVIGRTLRYEIRDEIDLWSEVEVEDTSKKFQRAAGILGKMGESVKLFAVLATDLSREEILRLVL